MSWTWSWDWIAHEPASFGDNPLADWIRVACAVLAIILVMSVARVIVEQARREVDMTSTQIARFVALALAAISISFTEIAVLGTVATPRLIINVACLMLGAYGVYGIRAKQKQQPIREDAR